jgi:hypothetical protein
MPLVLAGTATILALSKNLFERFDGAHVGFWRACTHRDTEADLSKIDVGSGDDPVCGDQIVEAFAREDHQIGRHAAGKLCGNGLRSRALRRTRSGGDLKAARSHEVRQQLVVGAGEAAGDQNVQVHRLTRHLIAPRLRNSAFILFLS